MSVHGSPSAATLLCVLCACAEASDLRGSRSGPAPTREDVGPDSDGGPSDASGPESDGGRTPGEDGGAVDAGPRDGGTEANPWAPLRRALRAEVETGGLLGYAFTVRTGSASPVFEAAGGAYELGQLIPTDSAIKPLTGLLVMTLIRDGRLRLGDDMGELLGWSGPEAAVTVEQLLSFTSGFDGAAPCLSPPASILNGRLFEPGDGASLSSCAESIRAGGLVATPGAVFTYGGSHQALLAAAVEAATGEDWDALFQARILEPLGLTEAELRYANNRVAGAAVATSAALTRVLEGLALDLGVIEGLDPSRLLPRALAEDFVESRTGFPVDRSDTPWRLVPEADPAFGLGIWIDCPDEGRAPSRCRFVAAGANGTTAWIDVEGRYVAALSLYQSSPLGFRDGYRVLRDIAPLISQALGREAPEPGTCLPAGDHRRSVMVDGVSHPYVVHAPSNRGPDQPLIVQLHGGGSTGEGMDLVSGLSALSDDEGFVVVTPEGWPVVPGGPQVWKAGSCCGPDLDSPDHVAVIDAILDAVLEEDACVDSGRLYATGHSNGGMMAYRLACELSRRVTAVAVSAGSLMNVDLSRTPPEVLFPCEPVAPVSILHVHGREDGCVPYDGGPTPGGALAPPVEQVIEGWRQRLGCEAAETTRDGAVRRSRSSCRSGTSVEFVSVEALGHPWAGSAIYPSAARCGGATTDAVSTTEELWRFFQSARR